MTSYQKIDVDGFFYDGIDRLEDYRIVFNQKPKNLTIMDVGCNNGFYILKAISEGARYALGIDNHDKFLGVGLNAARFLKYGNIDFIQLDVLKDEMPYQKFDIVLCLNLVHHFENIDQVHYLFDELYKRCCGMMIFEVLNCETAWCIQTNKLGNKKIHIGVDFFKEKYTDYLIESYDSKVTNNRKIVKVLRNE